MTSALCRLEIGDLETVKESRNKRLPYTVDAQGLEVNLRMLKMSSLGVA